MIEVVSRQRQRKMDCERWQAFGEKAIEAIQASSGNAKHSGDATIAFVSDRQIKELNKRFRGFDKATDVLSFPAEGEEFAKSEEFPDSEERVLGDIAISVERAATQAKENGLPFEQEIAQLILHGLLHLCGYDHETDDGEMNSLEIRLRRKLRI
ncbi:MAG TPA: rRNA maturation RNase YbeY [Pyrinomonadaceae bacterium]|nr:rRNA maturation RNase YbeY [Pyrinomonadaceae bacterium]